MSVAALPPDSNEAMKELELARDDLRAGRTAEAYERTRQLNVTGLEGEAKARALLGSAVILKGVGKSDECGVRALEAYKAGSDASIREAAMAMVVDAALASEGSQLLAKAKALASNDPVCRVLVEEAELRRQFIANPNDRTVGALQQLLEANPNNEYLQGVIQNYHQIADTRGQYQTAIACADLVSRYYPSVAENPLFQLNKAATLYNMMDYSGAMGICNALLAKHGDEFDGVHIAYWNLAISAISLSEFDAADVYLNELENRLGTYSGPVNFAEQIEIRREEVAAGREAASMAMDFEEAAGSLGKPEAQAPLPTTPSSGAGGALENKPERSPESKAGRPAEGGQGLETLPGGNSTLWVGFSLMVLTAAVILLLLRRRAFSRGR